MSRKSARQPAEAEVAAPSRTLRWLLVLVAIVVLLPTLLTSTGQLKTVLNLSQPRLARFVRFDCGTTHWWSNVRITNVSVRDATEQPTEGAVPLPLATADVVTIRQPLWEILMSGGRGLQLQIERPVLNLRSKEGRTNIERTLTEMLGSAEEQASNEGFPIDVSVTEGTVHLLGQNSLPGNSASLKGITGRIVLPGSPNELPEIDIQAVMQGVDHFAARGLDVNSGVNPRIAASLDGLSSDFSLLPFTDEQMNALANSSDESSIQIQFLPDPQTHHRQLMVEARRLNLSEFQPMIERLAPGTICSGKVSCLIQGQMLGDISADGIAGRMRFLAENFHLRQSSWAPGEHIRLETVSGQGAVAYAMDGLLVRDLKIDSSLMDLTGSGEVRISKTDPVASLKQAASLSSSDERQRVAEATAASAGQVAINGRIDLAALSRMIPRTLEISDDVNIASADVRFSTRLQQSVKTPTLLESLTSVNDVIQWQMAAQTTPIRAVRGQQNIEIPSALRIDGLGTLTGQSIRLDRGRFSGTFGSVDLQTTDGGYNVTGDVEPRRLWADFRQLLNFPEPQINGSLSFTGRIQSGAADEVALRDVRISGDGLNVRSSSLTYRPQAAAIRMLVGDAVVDARSGTLKTVLSPWMSLDWLEDSTQISVRIDADPESKIRLAAQATPDELTANGYSAPQGHVSSSTGPFDRASALKVSSGRMECSIIADPPSGGYLVEQGKLQVPGLNAAIQGMVTVPAGVLQLNLVADTQYDLEQLQRSLVPDLSRNILLTGQGQDRFEISGHPAMFTIGEVNEFLLRTNGSDAHPDISPLTCSGALKWTSGVIAGLPLGPGTVTAQLKDGLLRCEPIHCSLGTGTVDVMPQWDLTSNRLQLASGSRIQNIELTPDLSRQWMGYLSPFLSEAASVSGKISARTHRFDYAPDHPEQSTIQAVLTIHQAVASPGSSMAPLIQVLDLIDRKNAGGSRELQFAGQEIPFELRDGMVYHDGLSVSVSGYEVRSSGAVGMDRRISMNLQIPLQRSEAGQLRTNSLTVPVSGTLDRPQIDTGNLLQNLGRQQIQNQFDQQLDKGLNKLLNKLK